MYYLNAVLTEEISYHDENRRVRIVKEGTDIEIDIVSKGAVVVKDDGKPSVMTKDTYIGRVRNKTPWFDINRNEFTIVT